MIVAHHSAKSVADNSGSTVTSLAGSLSNLVTRARDWALDNQERVRQQVLERTKGIDNKIDFSAIPDNFDTVREQLPDQLKENYNAVRDSVSDFIGSAKQSASYSSLGAVAHSGSVVSTDNDGHPGFDYLNADLSKHYGMDQSAAYAEALQNTAYQRAVADLKAAGLNPVLAAGKVSPAGSFVAGDTFAGGSGSGSSGAASGGNSGRYALSGDSYNMLGVIGSIAGAIAGYTYSPAPWKLMGASTGLALGKALTQGFAQGASSFLNLTKR